MKHSKQLKQTTQENQSLQTKQAEPPEQTKQFETLLQSKHAEPLKQETKYSKTQIARILQQNTPPAADPQKRDSLIGQLTTQAHSMDYMGSQSLLEKLSSQITYMSPWSFLLQAGILVILFCFSFAHALQAATFCLISLTTILTGSLIYELSKSFGHNMWEMEAACRYNLAKLFYLRICILSAIDFVVLSASLAAFHIAGGMLWQFACYTLLPFFLASALCLWLMQLSGNLFRQTILLSACALTIFADLMILSFLKKMDEHLNAATLDTIFLWFSLGAMILFLLCAFRLCTRKHFVHTAAPTPNL